MRRGRALLSAASCLLCLAWSSPAWAEVGEAMARGLQQLRAFEYDEAVATFRSVIADPAATPAQRLEALERIGALEFSRNQREQAQAVFGELLDRDPEHRLTERAFPPPVEAFFAEVSQGHSPRQVVSLEAAVEERGSGLSLRATLTEGADAVQGVSAFVRGPGDEAFSPLSLERDGDEFVADLPATAPGEAVEYYLTAVAPSGHELAAVGSEGEPQRFAVALPVEPPPPPPPPTRRWYRTWWFWTVVGVVVAGGVATAVAVPLATDEPPTGSLGSGQLQ